MKYLFYIYCPDEPRLIDLMIQTASKLGAGVYGNYSHSAFITHGDGTWKSEEGAHPFEGVVGEITRSHVARISMSCNSSDAKHIEQAIKSIHPWEQVDLEFIRLENI